MRKIGGFLCLITIVFIIRSCTPVSIADNKRIQVKGAVLDNSNQPQNNISVSTYTYVGGNYFLSYPDLEAINSTLTNNQGSFSLTSLDVNPGEFLIRINKEERNNLESITYYDSRSQREETLIDLANIKLKKRILFKVVINTTEEIPFKALYANQAPVILINNWDDMQEIEDEYLNTKILERRGTLGPDENGNFTLEFETLEDTEIELSLFYNSEERIFNIPVTAQNAAYEINL